MHKQAHQTPMPPPDRMVDPIGRWLESEGFAIVERDPAGRWGLGIIADHPQLGTWRIAEAEPGATTVPQASPEGDAAMKGFFVAAAIAEAEGGDRVRVGLAAQRTPAAEQAIARIRATLQLLGIAVLWIEPSGAISVEEAQPPNPGVQTGLRPEELNASNDD